MQYPRVKLGDVCEVRSGSTHHGIEDVNGKYPVYGSGGLISRATNWRCPANTVIVGRKGTLDNPMLIREPFWNIDTCFGVICGESILPEYLLAFCQKTDFFSLVPSSGRPSTTSDSIRALKIPLPPLSIQQEIVAKLEKELARVAELAESFKRMAELADEEFKAVLSETFEHVEGKKVKLGDVCSKLSTGPFGSVLHKNDYVENGIPLVNPMHIIGDSIVPSRDMTVSVETAKRLEAYKLSQGDIVIGRRGEMGRAAVVTSKEDGWLCGTGSFYLHLQQQIEPAFFLLCFKSPKCIHQMVNTAKGATMQNLNHGLLKSLELVLPSKETQLKIVKDITLAKEHCKKVISYSQQSLSLCSELRKSILQEAFT